MGGSLDEHKEVSLSSKIQSFEIESKGLQCSSRALNVIWGILELRLLARSEDVLIGGNGQFN